MNEKSDASDATNEPSTASAAPGGTSTTPPVVAAPQIPPTLADIIRTRVESFKAKSEELKKNS